MTAPTLTEFLLARIAEDEASTVDASEVGVQYKVKSYGNGLHDLWDDDWLGGVRIDTTRILAECEAKRRIVELHPLRRFTPTPNTWDARDVCPTCHGHGHPCDTLRHLASVYADHPDFDEDWRA